MSEFKAVLAHEFGHFSQKSMKLGSFVYNVNKMIYNLLYDNEGYNKSLQKFARMSSYFSIFARLTINFVEIFQDALKKMYGFVNKRYMALSREMEFHADAVSASVSGSEPGISALCKTEIADISYNSVLNKCGEWVKENKYAGNIYSKHLVFMQFVAEANNLPLKNGLPAPRDNTWKGRRLSKLTVKDQWASHPTADQRIARLRALHVEAALQNEPAWVIFSNPVKLQETMTEKIHEKVVYEGARQIVSDEEFRAELKENEKKFSLPKVFKRYYDDREIAEFDIPAVIMNMNGAADPAFQNLLNDDACTLFARIQANKSDILFLEHINKKETGIRSFDYDGIKQEWRKAYIFAEKLEKETNELEEKLKATDIALFKFFFHKAKQQRDADAEQLKNLYFSYFNENTDDKELFDLANETRELMADIFGSKRITFSVIETTIGTLKENYEPRVKEKLKHYIEKGSLNDAEFERFSKTVSGFINSTHTYFEDDHFKNDQLAVLNEVLLGLMEMRSLMKFRKRKAILVYQEGLLEKVSVAVV